MGTAASHSSEEEEEGGAEEGMEGTAAAPQPGAPFPPGASASPAPPPLPPAEVLLDQARLREATARLREAALPESLVSRHHSTLVRWLEERLSRGDEAVSLEQFCEVLESVSRLAAGSRGESEEVRRRPAGSGLGPGRAGGAARGRGAGKKRLRPERSAARAGGTGAAETPGVLLEGPPRATAPSAGPLTRPGDPACPFQVTGARPGQRLLTTGLKERLLLRIGRLPMYRRLFF